MKNQVIILSILFFPGYLSGCNGGGNGEGPDADAGDQEIDTIPDPVDVADIQDTNDPAPDPSDTVEDELIADTVDEDGHVTDEGLTVGSSGHYLRFRGRTVVLVGDSVTQGWMELGANFNHEAYFDALHGRGIQVIMIWSYIGIEDQSGDERIGYDAPEIWPWNRSGPDFDLTSLNDAYFNHLQNLAAAADDRDMVLLITVHDGGVKWRFGGHPFNSSLGGPLSSDAQYVELHDFGAEMPGTYDPGWDRQSKNQYFQERFCDRMISALEGQTNVIYEMFNEGEWYNQGNLLNHQAHFLSFSEARTTSLLAVNDDHVGGSDPDFQDNPECDIISYHRPQWDSSSDAVEFFNFYAAIFDNAPAKPSFFSEPVPSFEGDSGDVDAVMRMAWGTALGGAGFVLQNDASFGFDPSAAIASRSAGRDAALDRLGYAAQLLGDTSFNLENMRPMGSLSSSGIALAEAGSAYIVYSQSGDSVTVDLSDASGTLTARFYNPADGTFRLEFTADGGDSRTLEKPTSSDWVLVLTR